MSLDSPSVLRSLYVHRTPRDSPGVFRVPLVSRRVVRWWSRPESIVVPTGGPLVSTETSEDFSSERLRRDPGLDTHTPRGRGVHIVPFPPTSRGPGGLTRRVRRGTPATRERRPGPDPSWDLRVTVPTPGCSVSGASVSAAWSKQRCDPFFFLSNQLNTILTNSTIPGIRPFTSLLGTPDTSMTSKSCLTPFTSREIVTPTGPTGW